MIRVIGVVGQLFDELEQVDDKGVVDGGQVVERQALDPRHVAEQLEQQAVQARVVVLVALDEVEQAGEGAFGQHHVECGLVAAAVVEQDGRDDVQHLGIFLLDVQKGVNSCGGGEGWAGRTCSRQ